MTTDSDDDARAFQRSGARVCSPPALTKYDSLRAVYVIRAINFNVHWTKTKKKQFFYTMLEKLKDELKALGLFE